MKRKVYAIILASGKGERADSKVPKQFIEISGKTIIEHTIDAFEKNELTDEIFILIEPSYREFIEKILLQNRYSKVSKILYGGTTRRESSFNGVNEVPEADAKILIHDAARPLVSDPVITNCIKALDSNDAVNTAIPATDTIIRINSFNYIDNIPDRSFMMQSQTPQAFRSSLIKTAHSLAQKDNNETLTDDCGLIVRYGLADVFIVKGDTMNIKITYAQDIYLAQKLFELRSQN